jgi:phage terminase large subunit
MAQANLPEWAECLFDEKARYIAVHGGRGSGKSRSVASALVIRAAAKPLRVLCAREIQKSIKDSVKRLLDDEIERLGLGSFFTSTDTEIRGQNGSLFIFAGLRGNPDSIKSMEGVDIAWVEEAATVSQTSLNILTPTIRKPGSQIIFTWNPRNPDDPVDAMFSGDVKPPKSIVRQVNYTENPWFPEVLRQELEYDKKRDYDKYLHVWEGQYQKNSEARVFKNWEVSEFDTPSNAVFRFGADWGYSVDPTTLVRCWFGRLEDGHAIADPRGRHLFIDYEAWEIGCEIDKTPLLFEKVPDSAKWPIVADSSRPETISYLMRNGYPKIAPAIKGARSVEEGVEFLRSYDIVVHPRCRHTIDELTSYSYEIDDLTGAPTNKLADKNNHVIDALRYALEGLRRSSTLAKPLKYPSLGLRKR